MTTPSNALAIDNPAGNGPLSLICEHASNAMPDPWSGLGLSQADQRRHIAWDLGALNLAQALSARFSAPLLHSRYSRLIADDNRSPRMKNFIPVESEASDGNLLRVPGNQNLSVADVDERKARVWQPFHDGVAIFLAQRDQASARKMPVVSIHSFTPRLFGQVRSMRAGILFDRQRDWGEALVRHLAGVIGEAVGRNEPYAMSQESDYTIPTHGEDAGRPCLAIEIRQDQLATSTDMEAWARRLERALVASALELGLESFTDWRSCA